MFNSELNGSRVEPEYANVSRVISVSLAFWIESATAAESRAGTIAGKRAVSFTATAGPVLALSAAAGALAAATVVFGIESPASAFRAAESIAAIVMGSRASAPQVDCA